MTIKGGDMETIPFAEPMKATLAERFQMGRERPGDPFEMPPDHDVHLAITAIKTLLDGGHFADRKDIEWGLNAVSELMQQALHLKGEYEE